MLLYVLVLVCFLLVFLLLVLLSVMFAVVDTTAPCLEDGRCHSVCPSRHYSSTHNAVLSGARSSLNPAAPYASKSSIRPTGGAASQSHVMLTSSTANRILPLPPLRDDASKHTSAAGSHPGVAHGHTLLASRYYVRVVESRHAIFESTHTSCIGKQPPVVHAPAHRLFARPRQNRKDPGTRCPQRHIPLTLHAVLALGLRPVDLLAEAPHRPLVVPQRKCAAQTKRGSLLNHRRENGQ